MPGNRAIALGEDIDYAEVRIDSAKDGALAQAGERVLVALALLPQLCEAAGVETHHLLHVHKGRELLGTVCAHPMRGRGYDHDVTVYSAEYVTTEAGTGFVHIAPGHGEEDFELGRQHGIEIPETVGEDGTFNAWVPHFAGQHVYKVADAVCAALTEAGGLIARGKLVHSYPHSWRSKAPLICALLRFWCSMKRTACWIWALSAISAKCWLRCRPSVRTCSFPRPSPMKSKRWLTACSIVRR
jgi:isoleucyl-tRNA synthetase